MGTNESQDSEPAQERCWALCHQALRWLGWDADRSLDAVDAQVLELAHGALWTALDLVFQEPQQRPATLPSGSDATPLLSADEIEALRSLPLVHSADTALRLHIPSPSEARSTLGREIHSARVAGLLEVSASRGEPQGPLPEDCVGALREALKDRGFSVFADWLQSPGVAALLVETLAVILFGALRAAGRPTPSPKQRAGADKAWGSVLLTLVPALVRARRTSDVVPKGLAQSAPPPSAPQVILSTLAVSLPPAPSAMAPSPVAAASAPGPALPEAVRRGDDVQFTVYRPRVLVPCTWSTLLAFAHLTEKRPDAPKDAPDPLDTVRRQASAILGSEISHYQPLSEDAGQPIPYEGQLTFIPEVPGVEFDPPRASFRWLDDVHRIEFRLRAGDELRGKSAHGQLTVLCGSVIVAEVTLALKVASSAQTLPPTELEAAGSARMYRKIFASYSHKDSAIVAQFRELAKALGDRYLIDVSDLRAGERWSEALEQLIREADVFQLFWSWNSIRSEFVQREWQYALALERPSFLRPTYWEQPMPELAAEGLPPPQLKDLHFQSLSPTVQRETQAPAPPAADATATPTPTGLPAPPAPRERRPFLRWVAPLGGALAAMAALLVVLSPNMQMSDSVAAPSVTSHAPVPNVPVEPVPSVPEPAPPPPLHTGQGGGHGKENGHGSGNPPGRVAIEPAPKTRPARPQAAPGSRGHGGATLPSDALDPWSDDPSSNTALADPARPRVGTSQAVAAWNALVARETPRLRLCLRNGPASDAAGPVKLRVRISLSGEPVAAFPDTMPAAVRACITRRMQTWRVPAQGQEIALSFTLL